MDLDRMVPPEWLPMDIVRTPDHRFALLTVGGELDASTAPALLAAVMQMASPPVPERVELNLAGLTFIDSAGLRCLLDCRNAVLAAGSSLVLVDRSPQVVRTLEITGMAQMFDMAPGHGSGSSRRRSPHRPQSMEELFEDSLALRQAAKETCARARAARSTGVIGELRQT